MKVTEFSTPVNIDTFVRIGKMMGMSALKKPTPFSRSSFLLQVDLFGKITGMYRFKEEPSAVVSNKMQRYC